MIRNNRNLSVILFLLFSAAGAFAEEGARYDVVVVGAGTSGCAAAIQAARMGASAAVIEASDYIGGQLAAGVTTMDDLGRTRTGIYREFIERVRSYYSVFGTATNICLWGSDTIAAEPSAARDILTDMLCSSGVAVYTNVSVTRAIMDGNKVTALEAEKNQFNVRKPPEKIIFTADVFIDATEHGDLLPLTGAEYRAGNGISPTIGANAGVQDITYVAVMKRYSPAPPAELVMTSPPPRYEEYAPEFRATFALSGDRWPGSYPFDIPSFKAYRALPDTSNKSVIIGGEPDTWGNITRTCLNWGNDFPGGKPDEPGLGVSYTEDMDYRRRAEREAMNKTLAMVWYIQRELGMADWAVDDGQGYGVWFSNEWESAGDPLLPEEFAPILKHFPPFPYVRESRRIVGTDTLTQSDISRDAKTGRSYKNYSSGVALAEYPVDIHGSRLDRYMEHDLGESESSFPKGWEGYQGVFQIPFGALIPKSTDGLIAAEKNISVSRMVSGAARLQPITMHTGQAAGAMAALAVRLGASVRDTKVLDVQKALMDSDQWIAADLCADIDEESPYWSAVQWASLYEILPKFSRSMFGAILPIKRDELTRAISAALPEDGIILDKNGGEFVSAGEFSSTLAAAGIDAPRPNEPDLALTRGDAMKALFERQ
ncbi:hypothetical protein FACS1894167_01620 [Synergistales bacterium]|nr:hypothetical protein FACS1894167_01620 [Synergistales bacterium]